MVQGCSLTGGMWDCLKDWLATVIGMNLLQYFLTGHWNYKIDTSPSWLSYGIQNALMAYQSFGGCCVQG